MPDVELLHPDRERLAAFALGRLGPDDLAEVERHVAACAACCQALRQVGDDSLVRLAQAAARTPRGGVTQTEFAAGGPTGGPAAAGPHEPPAELLAHPRYRVLELLGAGGMGVVFKAEHRLMRRVVALKVIHREFTSHPTAVDRFRREVQAAGRLSHPNIVTAHDAEQAGDVHFLVMEYVEGVSLARLVERKGPLPVAQACHFVRQAAQALQHAHERGMVHRDVKPQNLMVTRKGQLKVLDFGLARLAGEHGAAEALRTAASLHLPADGLTATSVLLGTPDYVAPEQARNSRDVDVRADVYSLGCTFYFLLTGQVPFPSGGAMDKLIRHTGEEPEPLERLRPDVPAEVAAVVRKLMAKRPADRCQTPGEVAGALTPILKSLTGTAEPPPAVEEPAAAEPGPATPRRAAATTALRRRRPRRLSSRRYGPWLMGAAFVVLVAAFSAAAWQVAVRLKGQDQAGISGSAGADGPKAAGDGAGGGRAAGSAASGKILYVVPRRFWHEDFFPVRRPLEENGLAVDVASAAGWCESQHDGARVEAQVLLNRPVDTAPYAAVVFAGSRWEKESNPRDCPATVDEYVRPHCQAARVVKQLVDDCLREERVVAAICTGQRVLIKTGALRGRKAAVRDDLRSGLGQLAEKGLVGEFADESVWTDRNVVTAKEPRDAPAFAAALLRALGR